MVLKSGAKWALLALVILILFKIYAYLFLSFSSHTFFASGNDSDGYHAAAIGEVPVIINAWPKLLNALHSLGFYDRGGVSLFLFLLSLFVIPYLLLLNIRVKRIHVTRGVARSGLLLAAFYPTIFVFTLDMYRDVLMFAILLTGFLLVKKMLESRLKLFFLFPVFCLLSYCLFLLRIYLGFSLFISFFVFYVYSKTSQYLLAWIIFYLIGLIGLYLSGLLDPLLLYRGVEGFGNGGSTLGIGLHGQDPISFFFLYLYSVLGQLFGLYLINIPSIIFFLLESLPFLMLFFYVFKNRKYFDIYVKYLVVFFIIYATIWGLGNDNLGTAIRLRVPNYLAIYICFFIVFQRKDASTDKLKLNQNLR
mgnify:CR=1 FL=1|tara:strand:- start:3948 stop:5033 length:1086 start_codon:yes stop_codon:yes gene_type:complete